MTPHVEMAVTQCDDKLDWQPIPKFPVAVLIAYPMEMERAGVAGEVLATMTVEPDGSVSDVVIDRASMPEFINPVVRTLPKCTFFPGKVDGIAVRTWVKCRVAFEIEDD
jgi:TonB family protein